MPAKIIDGKAISAVVRKDCRARVQRLAALGVRPSLAVILVGRDAASKIYVRNKIQAAESVGVVSHLHEFPDDAAPGAVLELIRQLNIARDIHGILVQLPLPPQFDIYQILRTISPNKDVDGFHLYNVGGLVVGSTIFPPCTPFGVMKLLDHEGIKICGQNVVVVGASNIVGKPMALMLLREEATVTVCHARTRDLGQFTILADILIVAAGVPGLIVKQMVKQDAVVIDVGINRLPSGRIVGDVDYDGVRDIASYITPVPGGVGPMTVTMLLSNTIAAAERQVEPSADFADAG